MGVSGSRASRRSGLLAGTPEDSSLSHVPGPRAIANAREKLLRASGWADPAYATQVGETARTAVSPALIHDLYGPSYFETVSSLVSNRKLALLLTSDVCLAHVSLLIRDSDDKKRGSVIGTLSNGLFSFEKYEVWAKSRTHICVEISTEYYGSNAGQRCSAQDFGRAVAAGNGSDVCAQCPCHAMTRCVTGALMRDLAQCEVSFCSVTTFLSILDDFSNARGDGKPLTATLPKTAGEPSRTVNQHMALDRAYEKIYGSGKKACLPKEFLHWKFLDRLFWMVCNSVENNVATFPGVTVKQLFPPEQDVGECPFGHPSSATLLVHQGKSTADENQDVDSQTLPAEFVRTNVRSYQAPDLPAAVDEDFREDNLLESVRIEKRLGDGHFGEVFMGQLPIACKKLTKNKGNDQALLREAKALQSVTRGKNGDFCKYVVHLHGIFRDPVSNDLVIAMEYCDGGNLSDAVKRQDLSRRELLEDTLHWAKQISKGMDHIVRQGFVHRDLRAVNVMLHGRTAKVGDLGLTRPASLDEPYGWDLGGEETPVPWYPPEAVSVSSEGGGERALTLKFFLEKSDIWSFGCVIFECLSRGQPPWLHQASLEQKQREWPKFARQMLVEKKRLPRPAEAPEDWYAEISKCWTEDWKDRPTFNEVLQALKALKLPDKVDSKQFAKSNIVVGDDGYVV